MRSLSARATLAGVATLLVALSCDAPSRTVAPGLTASGTHADVTTTDPLRAAIEQLYAGNTDPKTATSPDRALAAYDAMVGDRKDACDEAGELVALLLADYRADAFGPAGDDGLAAALKGALDGVAPFCPASLPADFPARALGANGAAAFVRAAVGGKVETLDGLAGADVPAGSLPGDALLTITRIPFDGTKNVLGTTLQAGPFYDIATYPHFDALAGPVHVGLVQVGPFTLAKNVDGILGHLPGGGSTEIPAPEQCTVPSTLAGLFVAPHYLAKSLRPALARAPRGVAALVAHNDSSGTAGGCGSASSLSPFGLVQVYAPGSHGKQSLEVAAVCGTTFEIANRSDGDLVAIWRALPAQGLMVGQADPTAVIVPGGGKVTVNAPAGTARLRVEYGPEMVASAEAGGCSG